MKLEDISNGKESLKIPLVNELGGDIPGFKYVCTSFAGSSFTDVDDFEMEYTGCDCGARFGPHETCSEDGNCECVEIRSRGRSFDSVGRLVSSLFDGPYSKPIFECNSHCLCGSECSNRVVQLGIRQKLCVFRTIDRGFALRTRDPISKGEFVCEYAGETIDYREAKSRSLALEPSRDNYLHVLREYVAGNRTICTYVDPTFVGNVGRFANHSCEPNLLMVPVRIHNSVPKLGLFAMRDIEGDEELCFDYSGSPFDNSETSNGGKPCLCGSKLCRKFLPFDGTLF